MLGTYVLLLLRTSLRTPDLQLVPVQYFTTLPYSSLILSRCTAALATDTSPKPTSRTCHGTPYTAVACPDFRRYCYIQRCGVSSTTRSRPCSHSVLGCQRALSPALARPTPVGGHAESCSCSRYCQSSCASARYYARRCRPRAEDTEPRAGVVSYGSSMLASCLAS